MYHSFDNISFFTHMRLRKDYKNSHFDGIIIRSVFVRVRCRSVVFKMVRHLADLFDTDPRMASRNV